MRLQVSQHSVIQLHKLQPQQLRTETRAACVVALPTGLCIPPFQHTARFPRASQFECENLSSVLSGAYLVHAQPLRSTLHTHRCYAAAAAAGTMEKIKVENPVVDLDGDEMTRCVAHNPTADGVEHHTQPLSLSQHACTRTDSVHSYVAGLNVSCMVYGRMATHSLAANPPSRVLRLCTHVRAHVHAQASPALPYSWHVQTCCMPTTHPSLT